MIDGFRSFPIFMFKIVALGNYLFAKDSSGLACA